MLLLLLIVSDTVNLFISRFCISCILTHSSAIYSVSPTHSTPSMVRCARGMRMSACGLLYNSLKVSIEQEKSIVLEDIKIIKRDPEASETDKAFADKVAEYLLTSVPSRHEVNQISTIKPCFLAYSDLCTVDGLNISQSNGCKKTFIARTYMDKRAPVSMNDGTLKPNPPGDVAGKTPAELVRMYGENGAGFFGEGAWWKQYNGILLGKHKWEAKGDLENDTNTLSEMWDMRWCFSSNEDAKNFHCKMIEVSKLGKNNGYLDGLFVLGLRSHEKEGLDNSIEDIVFCSNKPKKRASQNNRQGRMAMSFDPQTYLQQYTVVFVIDKVVVKQYLIEGFNPTQGSLQRSCLFGEKGVLNITAKAVNEWLSGERKEFDRVLPDMSSVSLDDNLPQWGDLTRCARCGVGGNDLKRCSRCKKVAYCTRGE